MGYMTRAEYNELIEKLRKRAAALSTEPYPHFSQTVNAPAGNGPLTVVERNIGRTIRIVLTEIKPADPVDAVIIADHLLGRVQQDNVEPGTAVKKMRSLLNLEEARKEYTRRLKKSA